MRHDDTTELYDSKDSELNDTNQECSIVNNVSNKSMHLPFEADPTVRSYEKSCEKRARLNNINYNDEQEMGLIGLDVSEASDSEVDSEVGDDLLTDKLAKWANNFQVKHNAVDSLLKILQESGHPNLPSSTRTLLNTARKVPVQIKSGMQYIYFPFANELIKNLSRYPNASTADLDTIELSFNVDGLPLFKSSQNSLWPILCAIVNIKPVTVFPVVLTYGRSKPHDLGFLEEMIRDLNCILKHGLQLQNKTFSVVVQCIVCDAPARAFVKGTKLYSEYFGCDKCCQKGKWVGRIV